MTALRFRDGPPHDGPAAALGDFLTAPGPAVRLGPGDDARALLPYLDRLALVEIVFPAFRDGRGYSSATLLREAGYGGELRAAGDVLVDQLVPMRRCGFDAFAPAAPIDPIAADRALARYAAVYQVAADARAPVWALRRG